MYVSQMSQSPEIRTGGANTKSVLANFWEEMLSLMNDVSKLQSGEIESINLYGVELDDPTSLLFSTAVGLQFNDWNNIMEFFINTESFKTDLYKQSNQMMIS